MMKSKQLLAASVLSFVSTVASSTVWVPDINESTGDFQEITFLNFFDGVDALAYDLVMFDAGTTASIEPSTTSLTLADINGIVQISANDDSPPYIATFGLDDANLGETAEFELALYDGISFSLVTNVVTLIPGNAYQISFGDIQGKITGVDLEPIPVPAAVWLFGTGLLGLVAVARRRV